MLSLADLEAAAGLVHEVMIPTPAHRWPLLSERAGAEVWVKHENHTPLGAFKIRGGLVYMTDLKRRDPKLAGVIAATRGNHGQSVAFALRRGRLPGRIARAQGKTPEKKPPKPPDRAPQTGGLSRRTKAAKPRWAKCPAMFPYLLLYPSI